MITVSYFKRGFQEIWNCKAIMYYLRQSRGVHVHASQIVVAAGMENLLFLLRQILGEKKVSIR